MNSGQSSRPNCISEITRTKKFRVGLWLFFIYAAAYIVFTVLGSFWPETFQVRLWGMNIGIVFGMILILAAIVMAILFNWYAGRVERAKGSI